MTVQTQPAGQPPLAGREGAADLDQPNARIAAGAERRRRSAARRRACAESCCRRAAARHDGRRPDRGASRPSRSASGSDRGLHAGCTPYGTTTTRSAGDRRRDQLVARGGAPHRIFRAALIPFSSCRPSARSTSDPPADPGSTPRKASRSWQRDERPACRQPRRQMRIAVVDDVEEIEVSDPGAKPSRVVPDAVENPIRCCPRSPFSRRAAAGSGAAPWEDAARSRRRVAPRAPGG